VIDKLELFLALARERHFGRTAEACNISQPTLSSAIRQLEEQLGVRLVRRGSRFQGLTSEGERTLEWARRIVGNYRTMHAEMRFARKGLSGNATIAVIPTALTMVHKLTGGFAATHPDITFTILSRTSGEIREMIANMEADLGITYLENEPLGAVVTVPLYHERYRFVTTDCEVAEMPAEISWSEAATHPLCLLTPDMQNRRILEGYLSRHLSAAPPLIETDSIVAMISHIVNGNCCGILPEHLAQLFTGTQGIAGRLCSIQLTDPDGVQLIGAIATKSEPHTPMVAALLRQSRQISLIS